MNDLLRLFCAKVAASFFEWVLITASRI